MRKNHRHLFPPRSRGRDEDKKTSANLPQNDQGGDSLLRVGNVGRETGGGTPARIFLPGVGTHKMAVIPTPVHEPAFRRVFCLVHLLRFV